MRLWILLFVALLVFGSENLETLFNRLFVTIFQKRPVKVYITKPGYRSFVGKSGAVEVVKRCEEADLVLGDSDACAGKYRFVFSREAFLQGRNVLGAFYWRKGRPQLRLKRDVLLKIAKRIPEGVRRYVY